MHEDFEHLDEEEKLKAENEFLKLKLMLERGGTFDSMPGNQYPLPNEVENEFLKNIMAFEESVASGRKVKVFDKIGRPLNFKPVAQIPDNEIGEAYHALLNRLHEHGINLDACSPNVTTRELYRFVTEELFEHETDDMNLPGWTTNYIYDEFHPDYVYDNTRAATDDCVSLILRKEPVIYLPHSLGKDLQLNERSGLTEDELKAIINRFKDAYDDLDTAQLQNVRCEISGNECEVIGRYSMTARISSETVRMGGTWKVFLVFKEDWGHWYIYRIVIDNINF